MKTYYFPAGGFGFWYLLGKYKQLEKSIDDVYIGSSAGSLICVCSLIDKKYNLFETVLKCAMKTLKKCKQKTQTINLYFVTSIFLDKLEAFVDKNTLAVNLTRIKIQVTEINGFHIKKHQIQPKSWEHLKRLCVASCYIPLICNWDWKLYYEIDGLSCIDGFFADLYYPNLFHTFDVSSHCGLTMPSAEKATEMYLTGLNESNKEEICWMINPYYIKVSTVVCIGYILSTRRV